MPFSAELKEILKMGELLQHSSAVNIYVKNQEPEMKTEASSRIINGS